LILNNGQQYAVNEGEKWYKNQMEQVFSIVGPAGSGKTTIVFQIMSRMKIDIEQVIFVTYTGKSTLPLRMNNLPAKTIHATCYTREENLVLDEYGKPIVLPTGRYKRTSSFVLRDKLPDYIKLIVIDEAEHHTGFNKFL
jgi:Molybdopterin-guanine dinucleotide biosynthesis protein